MLKQSSILIAIFCSLLVLPATIVAGPETIQVFESSRLISTTPTQDSRRQIIIVRDLDPSDFQIRSVNFVGQIGLLPEDRIMDYSIDGLKVLKADGRILSYISREFVHQGETYSYFFEEPGQSGLHIDLSEDEYLLELGTDYAVVLDKRTNQVFRWPESLSSMEHTELSFDSTRAVLVGRIIRGIETPISTTHQGRRLYEYTGYESSEYSFVQLGEISESLISPGSPQSRVYRFDRVTTNYKLSLEAAGQTAFTVKNSDPSTSLQFAGFARGRSGAFGILNGHIYYAPQERHLGGRLKMTTPRLFGRLPAEPSISQVFFSKPEESRFVYAVTEAGLVVQLRREDRGEHLDRDSFLKLIRRPNKARAFETQEYYRYSNFESLCQVNLKAGEKIVGVSNSEVFVTNSSDELLRLKRPRLVDSRAAETPRVISSEGAEIVGNIKMRPGDTVELYDPKKKALFLKSSDGRVFVQTPSKASVAAEPHLFGTGTRKLFANMRSRSCETPLTRIGQQSVKLD